MASSTPPAPQAIRRGGAAAPRAINPDSLGALLAVESARLVVIHDAWSGDNDDAPITASYELRREESGALAGTCRQFKRHVLERADEIILSAAAATRFLRRLADAVVVPGPYVPLEMFTLPGDDIGRALAQVRKHPRSPHGT